MSGTGEQGKQPVPGLMEEAMDRREDPEEPADAAPCERERGTGRDDSLGTVRFHDEEPSAAAEEVEVIVLSPRTLMAPTQFASEVCRKREENLQLHRRGHAHARDDLRRLLPRRKRRVYACPEASCARHDPARALGDLAGIRSHYRRRHAAEERKGKFKCDLCGKRYAADHDWAAHASVCAPREHRCERDCGAAFSRRDGFLTHRAFCVALARPVDADTVTSALHRRPK